jgi:hypothetical protein
MLNEQNAPEVNVPEKAATPPPIRDVPRAQEASAGSQGSTVWGAHGDGVSGLNYRDYYWMMSLADFLVRIQKDDGSAPPISFSKA